MFGLFGKKQKKVAAAQQKAQLAAKMKASAEIYDEMRTLVRILGVVPKRYWNIDPMAIHQLNNIHRNEQDRIFGFCEKRIVQPSDCWRKNLSDPTQPNSCWDCECAQIELMCKHGDVRNVKRIRQPHTLDLKAYGYGE